MPVSIQSSPVHPVTHYTCAVQAKSKARSNATPFPYPGPVIHPGWEPKYIQPSPSDVKHTGEKGADPSVGSFYLKGASLSPLYSSLTNIDAHDHVSHASSLERRSLGHSTLLHWHCTVSDCTASGDASGICIREVNLLWSLRSWMTTFANTVVLDLH